MIAVLCVGLLCAVGWAILAWNGSGARMQTLIGRPAPEATIKQQKHHDDTAQALAVIDRAVELLRSGIPPARVMGHLATLPGSDALVSALTLMSRSLELGDPPHTAIRRHSEGLDPAAAEVFSGMASIWFVAQSAGAPVADMLARYAVTCRERADAARERDVALAGPQSTVRVLSWLPLLSLGLALLIGADPLKLVSSVAGALSLVSGAALLVAGRVWMRAMLRRVQ